MTALAFVVGVVLLVVGLAVSIALHEIGHLVPAKRFGVKVGQYMIGFGPTLWSRRIGETEYGVKALPLGGYISMAGMYPPSRRRAGAGRGRIGRFFATLVQDARDANDETLEGADETRVFYRLPVWKRVVIMLGGPFMNLLFAIVLFAVLLTGIGMQTATTTVASVSDCLLPAGQAECTPADGASPAAAAGLEAGDVIVSIDGTPVETFADASALIQAAPGEELRFTILRDGAERTVALTPEAREVDGVAAGFAGITSQVEYVRQPIWQAPVAAVENAGAVAGIVLQMPQRIYDTAASLVTGEERDPNGPLSIVGAGALAGEVAAADAPVLNRVSGILALLASLNIALFVFNLVPLLPLDGGHVVVALWDGLKRAWAKVFRRPSPQPVDATRLVPLTFAVFIGLCGMGAVLILADIFNPVAFF